MRVYLIKPRSNVYAEGDYNIETREIVVFKGATVSGDIREYKNTILTSKKIKELRDQVVKEGKLIQNIKFKSPSSAGYFITGRSTNGMVAWKNKNGVPIGEIYSKDEES